MASERTDGAQPKGGLLRRLGAALSAALLLAGCSTVADIGLPQGVPARPAQAPAYPAIHDMPGGRPEPTLSSDEQAQMQRELKEARERQIGKAQAAQSKTQSN